MGPTAGGPYRHYLLTYLLGVVVRGGVTKVVGAVRTRRVPRRWLPVAGDTLSSVSSWIRAGASATPGSEPTHFLRSLRVDRICVLCASSSKKLSWREQFARQCQEHLCYY